jgi:tRNA pseudouridine38-40 synthase
VARIAAGLEYDGRAYAGWQRQAAAPSVEAVVESALRRVADREVALVVAGRTDAGVHARGQVLHFDTDAERTPRAWVLGSNVHLPVDVALTWALPVPGHFHARYSAVARTYRYLVVNRVGRPALAAGRTTWWRTPLDVEAMAAAGAALVGEHDFSAFRAAECQARSPVRHVHAITVTRDAELVVIEVTANAFLHHMVRNIAGLLLRIGGGELPVESARSLLGARDRSRVPATAPPDGLYLWSIRYPDAFALPRHEDSRRLSAMIPGAPP